MQADNTEYTLNRKNSLKRQSKAANVGALVSTVVLLLFFVVITIPILWMLMSSFKETTEIFSNLMSFPKAWLFQNYVTAWNQGISKYFLNSVFITVMTCFLTALISSLAAYALTKFEFKGKNFFFILLIAGLMSSPQVSIIPLYGQIQDMGLHNTFWALILPYVSYQIPLTLLLFRSYFLGIDRAYEEAAYMDGCNSFSVYIRVIIPLSVPIILTSVVLTAFFAWNEFLFALVFIDDDALKTIPSGLLTFKDALHTDWGVMLAGLTLSALPIVLLFISMQKYFISGLADGGLKG